MSRLAENDTIRTNISNSSISEAFNINTSHFEDVVKSQPENSSSVDLHGQSSENKPQQNQLPVTESVIPSAFELLVPIKIEGKLFSIFWRTVLTARTATPSIG